MTNPTFLMIKKITNIVLRNYQINPMKNHNYHRSHLNCLAIETII